jgi:TatD DNase family protein
MDGQRSRAPGMAQRATQGRTPAGGAARESKEARVMELVDIQDLKSWGSNAVPVRFRPRVHETGEPPAPSDAGAGSSEILTSQVPFASGAGADSDTLRSRSGRVALIDSHCHLDLVVERGLGVGEITESLLENDICGLVEIGADKSAMLWARTLAHTARQFEVYYTIGHHPGEAATEDFEFGIQFIEENRADKKFVAVGEIGLDYHYHADQAEMQKRVFREFVHAARRVGRGIAIHTRDAHRDTVDILKNDGYGISQLIHCFTGTRPEMEEFLALGCYISFSGIVTFKNAAALQEAAKVCPLDKILIETDAPFLAPIPHRGKVNQPGYVRHTLDFLAKLRGEDVELLAAACTKNTREFYAIA